MTLQGSLQIVLVVAILLLLAIPLGNYLYRVFTGKTVWFEGGFAAVERGLYRLVGVNPSVEMDWKAYLKALLMVNFVMALFAYLIFRTMGRLPLNPDHIPSMSWPLAFNTAASFVSNTDWQNYAGESQMTILGQMVAITFLQFTSVVTGLVAAVAFLRGMTNRKSPNIGNFWVDFIRSITRLFLPLSFLLAIVFVGLGLPQTLDGAVTVHALGGGAQTISRGPVASLEAIKQLGTNGGGYFNANSAHPYEDPSALTTVLEIIAMGLIPTALVATFGKFIGNRRQAVVLYVFLAAMLLGGAFFVYGAEVAGNPLLHHLLGIGGPNMEGKEVRFGLPLTGLFTAATTAFTTGAVNAMHDSLTPLGGMLPLVFMLLNMVFGGVGVGLLNILMFLLITVFIAGLMVGRTPEIFGKKIEVREVKLATISMLVHPFLILGATAVAVAVPAGLAALGNPGLHGFTEVLYAYSSAAANNGSAFAGLAGNTLFYNLTIGMVILLGRYVSIIAMFAIAGSLAIKPVTPAGLGTLRTDTFTFGGVFVAVVLVVSALTFFPVLAIGPVAEHLQMVAGKLLP